MIYGTKTKHARYKLVHPEKYMENLAAPICKSSWEERIFQAMDNNSYVLKWGYEPDFEIYYMSPKLHKMSKYFPDIYCECKSATDSKVNKFLIEIKPEKFAIMPKPPKALTESANAKKVRAHQKKMARYYMQCEEVMVNQAKWAAARNWCANRGVNWIVLTEENVCGLFDKGAHI